MEQIKEDNKVAMVALADGLAELALQGEVTGAMVVMVGPQYPLQASMVGLDHFQAVGILSLVHQSMLIQAAKGAGGPGGCVMAKP